MALDSTQIKTAPNGHLRVAAASSTYPADVTAAYSGSWSELGYLDDGGVDITAKISTTDIPVWQSSSPGKTLITAVNVTLDYNLVQVNTAVTALYFFGSAWSVASGVATMTLASSQTPDERGVSVEWSDGTTTNRFTVPRGMVTDRQKMSINRKSAQVSGMTFEALDSNGVLAAWVTNNSVIVAGS